MLYIFFTQDTGYLQKKTKKLKQLYVKFQIHQIEIYALIFLRNFRVGPVVLKLDLIQ